jgi:hypothetical protein
MTANGAKQLLQLHLVPHHSKAHPLSYLTRARCRDALDLNLQAAKHDHASALEYAYRRCHDNRTCSVFWVHADSETTFTYDYKTNARKLRLGKFDGEKLLMAVRERIEILPSWLIVFDNVDGLASDGHSISRRINIPMN